MAPEKLERADFGLTGLGLALNIRKQPGASRHRTPLAYSRLIDTWSLLELPLVVLLTVPSSADKEEHATGRTHVLSSEGSEVSPATQAAWIERHVPLLMAKAPVQVIVWNQLSDASPHHYPHGGVMDAHDQPKPALESLKKIRQQLLL